MSGSYHGSTQGGADDDDGDDPIASFLWSTPTKPPPPPSPTPVAAEIASGAPRPSPHPPARPGMIVPATTAVAAAAAAAAAAPAVPASPLRSVSTAAGVVSPHHTLGAGRFHGGGLGPGGSGGGGSGGSGGRVNVVATSIPAEAVASLVGGLTNQLKTLEVKRLFVVAAVLSVTEGARR